MKWKSRFLAVAALSGVLGWALSGCSKSPLAPSGLGSQSAGSSGFSVLTISPSGAVGFVPAPTGSALSGSLDPSLSGTSGSGSSSSVGEIDGAKGGKLNCGRYSLTVPAGAFSGVATITMTLADSTVMLCDLQITPAELNDFQVPVQLSLETHELSVDLSTIGIYWYDPAQLAWVNMLAGSDPTSGTLTANLSHFSKYAAGKAGW